MIVSKHKMKPKDAPLADLPFGLKMRARASAGRKDGHHTGAILVYVADPPTSLLAHEVDHILRDEKAHCPAWHFCGRVGHGLRVFPRLHIHPKAWGAARTLVDLPYGVPLEVV